MRPAWVLGQSQALIVVFRLVGYARGEHLLIRGGCHSGAAYVGGRAPLLKNMVARPDGRRGNSVICAHYPDSN
jgi:hypothetical protein